MKLFVNVGFYQIWDWFRSTNSVLSVNRDSSRINGTGILSFYYYNSSTTILVKISCQSANRRNT